MEVSQFMDHHAISLRNGELTQEWNTDIELTAGERIPIHVQRGFGHVEVGVDTRNNMIGWRGAHSGGQHINL